MATAAVPAHAQSAVDDDRYTIMRPEPSVAPKYKSPRGTKQKVEPAKPSPSVERTRAEPPPPVVLPGGKVVPNLPVSPEVPPTARESVQDRTIRCTHQAGVFGVPADQRNLYIGSCVNQ
jgi:DNA segregation ATPase FtsK/SpoIIIE-like protein